MAILKVEKNNYETALNKVVQASKDFEAAVTRTGATNKNFMAANNGAWAKACDGLTMLVESQMRVINSALSELVTKMTKTGNQITGTLMPSRDCVFSAVSASCTYPTWVVLQENTVPNTDMQCQFKVQEVGSAAQKVITACDGLEDAGGIIDPLNQLKNDCRLNNSKFLNLLQAFNDYTSDVSDFNATASEYAADKFITDKMCAEADKATWKNSGLPQLKDQLKSVKTWVSNIGEALKVYDHPIGTTQPGWDPKDPGKSWRKIFSSNGAKSAAKQALKDVTDEFKKKLSESTFGLTNHKGLFSRAYETIKGSLKDGDFKGHAAANFKTYLKDFKDGILSDAKDAASGKSVGQHFKNLDDIKGAFGKNGEIGKFLKNNLDDVKDLAGSVKHGIYNQNAAHAVGNGLKKVDWGKVGKGLKAGSRYLGYVGDAITIGESAFKAASAVSRGDWKQAGGQILKGVTKIGVGKLLGAGLGIVGGPAGIVIGLTIGSWIQSKVDGAIDAEFAKHGIY